jgi:DNA-binding GntR family transcriptional regulator
MDKQTSESTRTHDTYAALRTDILNGVLQPGDRLQLAALSNAYGVSQGVLREVLPRLVGEGLARSEPQLGFSVISISPADLLELTECRLTIEVLALRQSIEYGDLSWESRLLAAHHVLANTASTDEAGVRPAWHEAHSAFHRELLGGCPNVRLLSVAKSLRDLAEVYQNWSNRSSDRRDVRGEHRQLLDATLGRDVELAVECLTEHIQRSALAIVGLQQSDVDQSGG